METMIWNHDGTPNASPALLVKDFLIARTPASISGSTGLMIWESQYPSGDNYNFGTGSEVGLSTEVNADGRAQTLKLTASALTVTTQRLATPGHARSRVFAYDTINLVTS